MAAPTPWWVNDQLHSYVHKREPMPDVDRLQTLYIKHGGVDQLALATVVAAGWEPRNPAASSTPLQRVSMKISEAPAEFCMPVKQDRRLSPSFKIRMDVTLPRHVAVPVSVKAQLITQQQKDNLIKTVPEEAVGGPGEDKSAKTFTELKGSTLLRHVFESSSGMTVPEQRSAPVSSHHSGPTNFSTTPTNSSAALNHLSADQLPSLGLPMSPNGQNMPFSPFRSPQNLPPAHLAAINQQLPPGMGQGMQHQQQQQMGPGGMHAPPPPGVQGWIAPSWPEQARMSAETGGPAQSTNTTTPFATGNTLDRVILDAASGEARRQQQQSTGGNPAIPSNPLTTISHEFEFVNLELLKPTRMNQVYMMFMCTLDTDVLMLLYHVPTIGICRAEQRVKACAKLGVPVHWIGGTESSVQMAMGGGGGAQHGMYKLEGGGAGAGGNGTSGKLFKLDMGPGVNPGTGPGMAGLFMLGNAGPERPGSLRDHGEPAAAEGAGGGAARSKRMACDPMISPWDAPMVDRSSGRASVGTGNMHLDSLIHPDGAPHPHPRLSLPHTGALQDGSLAAPGLVLLSGTGPSGIVGGNPTPHDPNSLAAPGLMLLSGGGNTTGMPAPGNGTGSTVNSGLPGRLSMMGAGGSNGQLGMGGVGGAGNSSQLPMLSHQGGGMGGQTGMLNSHGVVTGESGNSGPLPRGSLMGGDDAGMVMGGGTGGTVGVKRPSLGALSGDGPERDMGPFGMMMLGEGGRSGGLPRFTMGTSAMGGGGSNHGSMVGLMALGEGGGSGLAPRPCGGVGAGMMVGAGGNGSGAGGMMGPLCGGASGMLSAGGGSGMMGQRPTPAPEPSNSAGSGLLMNATGPRQGSAAGLGMLLGKGMLGDDSLLPVPSGGGGMAAMPPLSWHAMRDWIQDEYEATAFARKLTAQDLQALLSQAGFPLDVNVHTEHVIISEQQAREFQQQFLITLQLLRQIANVWNMQDPCVVAGFDMDRNGAAQALAAEPHGTFICRFSMSEPGSLVLSCKARDVDGLVHAIIKVQDLYEKRVDHWIRDYANATHCLDVYRGKRVDKMKVFATDYTRSTHSMLDASSGHQGPSVMQH